MSGRRLSEILSSLRRRVAKLTTGGRPFKIDITGNPRRRREHQRRQGDYTEMIVLYDTHSDKMVLYLERWLVENSRTKLTTHSEVWTATPKARRLPQVAEQAARSRVLKRY